MRIKAEVGVVQGRGGGRLAIAFDEKSTNLTLEQLLNLLRISTKRRRQSSLIDFFFLF